MTRMTDRQEMEDTMRALVIDDSKAMRMILKRELVALGFEVFEAGDGQEALSRLAELGAAFGDLASKLA